jgi:hypothetical protein
MQSKAGFEHGHEIVSVRDSGLQITNSASTIVKPRFDAISISEGR